MHTPANEYTERRNKLVAIRAEVLEIQYQLCTHVHELEIFTTIRSSSAPKRRLPTLNEALDCICPKEVRTENALCAHSTKSLAPDPFGKQAAQLIDLQVMTAELWPLLSFPLKSAISGVDREINHQQFEGTPLSTEARLQMQIKNIPLFHELRTQLLDIIATAIEELEQ